MKYRSLKGMSDLLPAELTKWQYIEERARILFEARGYREIRTPALEYTELFSRSIGEASDIVHKEMYSFEDRGGRDITLRPEATASVVRAVLEHSLLASDEPLALYYLGPMFRAERPQAGRKRQFYQFGVELIQAPGVVNDVRLVRDLHAFLEALGLTDFQIKMNHLGSGEDRVAYVASLKTYFEGKREALCGDCHYRLEKNVLRILDCKVPGCQPIITEAPPIELSEGSRAEQTEFKELIQLASSHLNIVWDERLVRGLDYYTGLVFEVVAGGLGAQDAIAAGGRYDQLFESFGGKATPATGFAIGLERLVLALDASKVDFEAQRAGRSVYVANVAFEDARSQIALEKVLAPHLVSLRAHHIFPQMGLKKSKVSTHLKRAGRSGARFAILCDEKSILEELVTVRDTKALRIGEAQASKTCSLDEAVRLILDVAGTCKWSKE